MTLFGAYVLAYEMTAQFWKKYSELKFSTEIFSQSKCEKNMVIKYTLAIQSLTYGAQ